MLNPTASAKLSAWLLAFFSAHAVPAAPCADPAACTPPELAERQETLDVRAQVTAAILGVAYDPMEATFARGKHARGLEALDLAALAAHETGLRPRLFHGICNPGECDGGEAFGFLQIHATGRGYERGLAFVGDRVAPCTTVDPEDAPCIVGATLLDSPSIAARIGLRILRHGGVQAFTGQGPNGEAVRWVDVQEDDFLARHPVPVTDVAALAP